MQNIQAIIFDMGRVLVHWEISRGLWKLLGDLLGDRQSERQRAFSRLYDSFATGRRGSAEFHRELSGLLGVDLAYEAFAAEWCDIFSPIDGMEALVEEVRARWPIAILSDTDPIHWEFLRRVYPFLQRFEAAALSFEIGHTKPAPETYLYAARLLGAPPEACIFIDDRTENVEGARRVGMAAVQFQGVGPLRAELEARRLL